MPAERFDRIARLRSRIAHRLAMLRYIQRNAGLAAAAMILKKQVVQSCRHRLSLYLQRRTMTLGSDPVAYVPVDPVELNAPPRSGVLFVGYVEAGLGLGESLRGLIRAASATSVPFAIHPYHVNVENRRTGAFQPHRYDETNRYLINVMEMSTDQLPPLLNYLGDWRLRDSYNILRTYWELAVAPRDWAVHLQAIDEIWAPNQFVASAFSEIFNGPITIVPPCIEVEHAGDSVRSAFGLKTDIFYFIFTFDYFSYPARKNPMGILEAFLAAFPDQGTPVGLVIKSTSSPGAYEDIKFAISKAAARDSRIIVIDDTLTRPQLLSLIDCCDAYVSLHRSEGFGLGMVEAMWLGKPVLATDYSGSRDFLSEATGFPIAYDLKPVRGTDYIFTTGQQWAEPELKSAVAAMRQVFYNRTEAWLRAERGRELVRARYSRDTVAAQVDRRFRTILAQLGRPL